MHANDLEWVGPETHCIFQSRYLQCHRNPLDDTDLHDGHFCSANSTSVQRADEDLAHVLTSGLSTEAGNLPACLLPLTSLKARFD